MLSFWNLKSGQFRCVYEMLDGSLLISYAFADGGNNARLVGLNSAHDVVFDFQYPNLSGCSTSWSAQGILLENINFK